jgi:L-glutamine-phosphate cytidylyltransferase
MQAIILAAGRGRRIQPLSNDDPKSYLPVDGKRLIDWQIDSYRRLGVSEIIVVVGFRKDRFVTDYPDLTLVFNPFYETTNVLTSFWFARHRLREDILFSHADTIFEPEVLRLLVAAPGDIVLPFDRRRCGAEEMKLSLEGDRVVRITKEMHPSEAAGEFIGLAKLSAPAVPKIICHAERFMERQEFGHYFEAAIQKVIDARDGQVLGVDITGLKWTEVDFADDYKLARRLFET